MKKKSRNRIFKKNSKKVISPWWFEKSEEKLQKILLKNSEGIRLEGVKNEG